MVKLYILILGLFLGLVACGEEDEKEDEVVTVQQALGQTDNIVLSPEDVAVLNNWNPGETKGNEVWTLEIL